MSLQDVAAALQRVEAVLQRRPETGLHDDAPAVARWEGGTRVTARHASGLQVATDMPCELGGRGDRVTPGWFVRAGLASCCTTVIAMAAARDGITLAALDVRVDSRTDTRGLFDMAGPDGRRVSAGPEEIRLHVRIAAPGVAPERLRALAEQACLRSPMSTALQSAVPLAVQVEVA